MIYRGHVKNGVVELDDNVNLPDGTPVNVQLLEESPPNTLAERFKHIIGKANDLPADMAAQHDHYIHGTPKQ